MSYLDRVLYPTSHKVSDEDVAVHVQPTDRSLQVPGDLGLSDRLGTVQDDYGGHSRSGFHIGMGLSRYGASE